MKHGRLQGLKNRTIVNYTCWLAFLPNGVLNVLCPCVPAEDKINSQHYTENRS